MNRRTCVAACLLSTAGCVQVRWYPLYGDVALNPEDVAAVTQLDTGEVPTIRLERHGMRDYPMDGDETRSRIESPWLRAVLFPVNLLANMVSNGVAGLVRPFTRSCCVALPEDFLQGVFYFGPCDAWHGYPFWEPTELDPRSIDWGYSL